MSLSHPRKLVFELLVFSLIVGLLIVLVYSPRVLSLENESARYADVQTPPPVLPSDNHFGVASPNEDVIWIVGNQGRIIQSSNRGRSWVLQQSGVDKNLMDIAAWGTDRAVVVGNGAKVLHTDDGGSHWQEASQVPRSRISNKLYRVRIAPGGSAWAVGERNAIIRSNDEGKTWSRMIPEGRESWYGIAFPSDTRSVVVGEFGTVIAGSRGERTWSWNKNNLALKQSLKSVDFRNRHLGVAVGLNGSILRTQDGGRTWENVKSESRQHLFTVRWQGDRWLALGAQGIRLEGKPSARSWRTSRLASGEFGWHVTQARLGGDPSLIITGANIGLLKGSKWQRLES